MTRTSSTALFVLLLGCSTDDGVAPASGDGGTDAVIGPDSSNPGDGGTITIDAGPPPPNPCVSAGTCPPGEWIDVTPKGVDVVGNKSCGNYGSGSVGIDPYHPGDVYAEFNCQGLWKSTDYGTTWTGPINTGKNGAESGDCAGGVVVARGTASAPRLYQACIRGAGIGFWESTNGGGDWTRYPVTPTPSRQDYYAPDVDPYDPSHLIMAGHEMNSLVESTDGGHTWVAIALDPKMNQNGGTAFLGFVDMGSANATRKTWLYVPQGTGGSIGTWRTTNGSTWTHVDKNERGHGGAQIFQPDKTGTVLMAGVYSDLGWGVLRSTDFGQTWKNVAGPMAQLVFGTKKHTYAMNGFPIGTGGNVDPNLQIAGPDGSGAWVKTPTPAKMTQGPAQAAVTNDGTHAIVFAANYNAGLWRYIEP